ncbi:MULTISPECIES: 4Fe-4S binding protein [unclassified Candidatus Frackibacter]|uniref:4Fe-4S binding protein n=1 Tax=unclassified Candidatus Frackibacter TaxID=2648818 RepID=UPI0008908D7B|nr:MULTISPECIES: 4Fe-4S binding protein [unclassified Candidatus Frackibacter]SDC56580.1 4Fe-4S binding domain-containing protein [Candidatus Frackibacter sp. WG11]SEM70871.1 4Fe-4S binding domain-containing protein [Candidatus Frackibacter sp. WG12]SFL83488.1 4Fe-4S binding domain-containing protein [Candidatus Frackibacter sp. WG13]
MLNRIFNLIEQIDIKPIKLEARYCTRVISSKSSCSSCIDICPQNAISIINKELKIDFNKCNNCGLCTTSCPNNVFELEKNSDAAVLNKAQENFNTDHSLLINCQAAIEEKNSVQIECLGRLSERMLLKLLFIGADLIWLKPGQCAKCQLKSGRALIEEIVHNCNLLLKRYFDESRVFISTKRPNFTPNAFGFRNSEFTEDELNSSGIGRREFINKLKQESVNGIKSLLTFEQKKEKEQKNSIAKAKIKRQELLSLIKRLEENAIEVNEDDLSSLFWKLEFDGDCDFCQVCTTLCPNGVLSTIDEESEKKIMANHKLCTNCGLCKDVCYKQQINIKKDLNHNLNNSEQEVIVGLKKVCNECQKEFYTAKQDKKTCVFCDNSEGIL